MDITTIAGRIIADSDELRNRYQEQYRGDPDAELLVWLQLAVQREAMVRFLYDGERREQRLAGATGEVVDVARDVMTLIWQQESTHTAELAARVIDGVFQQPGRNGAFDAAFRKTRGTLDAAMTNVLTGAEGGVLSALARVATWIAGYIAPNAVPAFASELPRANLREYFVLATALERTAKDSYGRLGELVQAISMKPGSIQVLGLGKPIKNVRLDETFHELVFREMTSWLDADGRFRPDLQAATCMNRLKTLLMETVEIQGFRGPGIPVVSTDGGLKPLFAKHHISIEVDKGAPEAST